MNIAFFTENLYRGGLDTFLINLFNAWPKTDDHLTLLCNAGHPGLKTIHCKTERQLEIKPYYRLFPSRFAQGQTDSDISRKIFIRYFFAFAYRLLQYPVLLPWYVLSLTFFFYRSNFDRLIVVNGGYPASLLCRAASIAWKLSGKKHPAIFNFHNSTTPPPKCYAWLEYTIDKLVIWSAWRIVSVSQNCLSSLECRPAFRDCNKLVYIYNGIADPTLEVHNSITANSYSASSGLVPYCLMLATYEPRKGHAFLLEAFKEVLKKCPNVVLKIYGQGTERQKNAVLEIVKNENLGGKVLLGDFEPQPSSLIQHAALMVVPSQSFESFGLTILEAMAHRVPVVTTDVGGMPEVMADTNAGFVCSKSDVIGFAESIIRILTNPALAVKMGHDGRKAFEERYSSAQMAKQYELLL